MSFVGPGTCKYHAQDADDYCGAACAMMLLANRKVPYTKLDQAFLFSKAGTHARAGWSTSPEGLAFLLNSCFNGEYEVFSPDNYIDGIRTIISSILANQQPVAVLIAGCKHWAVVTGFQTDSKPDISGYNFEGLWLNDPVKYHPNTDHNDLDDCGTDGTSKGAANRWMCYSDWSDHFTGFTEGSSRPQFIVVGMKYNFVLQHPTFKPLQTFGLGDKIIPTERIGEFAQQAIGNFNPEKNEFSAESLKNGKPGKPQFVRNLRYPKKSYYLIPLEREQDTIAIMKVNALLGNLGSLQILPKPVRHWKIAPSDIDELIVGKTFTGVRSQQHFTVKPKSYKVGDELVWKPCAASFNPLVPFYEVKMGKHTIYIRIDGVVFTELTIPKCGS